MVAAMESRGSGVVRRTRAGQILLAVGGLALLVELWGLWLEAGSAFNRAAVETVGWLGALGMATLQLVDFIAWNPHGILLSVARLLLLCWPVAMMLAGAVVSGRGH